MRRSDTRLPDLEADGPWFWKAASLNQRSL
jgi:hypothetical protein